MPQDFDFIAFFSVVYLNAVKGAIKSVARQKAR